MEPIADFAKVCVVGLGYIGLPTAAMFASRRLSVVGVDVDADVVNTVNRGEIHIVEPDLDIIVSSAVAGGWLKASSAPTAADAFLIAVPTPIKGISKEPDLSFVESASRSIAPHLKPGDLVVLESTCPVGATEAVSGWLAEVRPDLTFPQAAGENSDIRVAHCPERVLPGRVMMELISNDRILGGLTARCAQRAAQLYSLFVTGDCLVTDSRTAELAKLTENSFRDVNIAFANELSIICEGLGVDVWRLIELANRHPRVSILQPGPGVGGHCIAVDPWFLISANFEEARLLRAARGVNDRKPLWVVQKIHEIVTRLLGTTGPQHREPIIVTCYGIAFKADIDDLRGSPAISIVESLLVDSRIKVNIVEPHIATLPRSLSGASLVQLEDVGYSDIHVLLVDHTAFKQIRRPTEEVLDLRGAWRGQI